MEFSAYTAVYGGAAIAALATAAFIWQRREAPGAIWLLLIMVAGAQWTLCDALDMSSTTLAGHVFWAKCSYIGATPTSAFLLLFALEFTGRSHRVTRKLIAGLLAAPVVITIATFFNEFHGLTWTSFTPAPQDPSIIVYGHGPLYWLATVILTGYMLIATVILLRFALNNRNIYAAQSATILIGAFIPWIALMIYNFMPWLWPGLNPSIAMVATGAVYAFSLFSLRLLDLTPIARTTLVERLSTGVLVADHRGRVLDLNPSARSILGLDGPLGSGLSELLGDRWRTVADVMTACPADPFEFTTIGDARQTVSFAVAPLSDAAGVCKGIVVTIDDITERTEAHRALQVANAELTARIAEVERLHADLSEQAIRDPLTKLYNRRYLDEELARELHRAGREGKEVSVIMLDIDHFKSINDTRGHHVGDAVLCQLAAQLEQCTRAGDIACRYGGDEFLLVMAGTSKAAAMSRAEELRARFAASGELALDRATVTVSVGVATSPLDGSEGDALVAAADHAVYDAKAAGRDCVRSAHRYQVVPT